MVGRGQILHQDRYIGHLCMMMAMHVSMVSLCRAFNCGAYFQLFPINFRIATTQAQSHLASDFRTKRFTPRPGLYRSLCSSAISPESIGGDENPDAIGSDRSSRTPRALRKEEWQAAQSFITPELKAQYTLSDGSIDFKALSKLIPLQSDNGPLDVVFEDEDLIAVRHNSSLQFQS